jgi:hypothetical protein
MANEAQYTAGCNDLSRLIEPSCSFFRLRLFTTCSSCGYELRRLLTGHAVQFFDGPIHGADDQCAIIGSRFPFGPAFNVLFGRDGCGI